MSSDVTYIKGACTQCGSHIEFPREALGAEVACPHCGATTALLDNRSAPTGDAPPPAPPSPDEPASGGASAAPKAGSKSGTGGAEAGAKPSESFVRECPGCGLEVSIKAETCPACAAILREKKGINVKLLIPVAALAIVAAGFFAVKSGKLKLPKFGGASTSTAPAAGRFDGPSTPEKPVERTGKFEVLDYKIEKTPGTSLIYVVGSVLNDTDIQKFSVRVTFALTDQAGKPTGEATDYITVIEPGETWNFRALILDSAAEKATLTTLEAENP